MNRSPDHPILLVPSHRGSLSDPDPELCSFLINLTQFQSLLIGEVGKSFRLGLSLGIGIVLPKVCFRWILLTLLSDHRIDRSPDHPIITSPSHRGSLSDRYASCSAVIIVKKLQSPSHRGSLSGTIHSGMTQKDAIALFQSPSSGKSFRRLLIALLCTMVVVLFQSPSHRGSLSDLQYLSSWDQDKPLVSIPFSSGKSFRPKLVMQ
jgi:hypothetical protein